MSKECPNSEPPLGEGGQGFGPVFGPKKPGLVTKNTSRGLENFICIEDYFGHLVRQTLAAGPTCLDSMLFILWQFFEGRGCPPPPSLGLVNCDLKEKMFNFRLCL